MSIWDRPARLAYCVGFCGFVHRNSTNNHHPKRFWHAGMYFTIKVYMVCGLLFSCQRQTMVLVLPACVLMYKCTVSTRHLLLTLIDEYPKDQKYKVVNQWLPYMYWSIAWEHSGIITLLACWLPWLQPVGSKGSLCWTLGKIACIYYQMCGFKIVLVKFLGRKKITTSTF